MPVKKYEKFLESFKYEYGCIMMQFDVPNWKELLSSVSVEDLYTEGGYGLETEPHVTLLFGIYDSVSTEDVRKALEYSYQPYVTFKQLSVFNTPMSNFDVLKLEADSEYLHNINNRLQELLPHMSTHPVYNPHMTVAYLKSGRGISYIRELDAPIIIKPTKIVYSEPTRNSKKSIIDMVAWS